MSSASLGVCACERPWNAVKISWQYPGQRRPGVTRTGYADAKTRDHRPAPLAGEARGARPGRIDACYPALALRVTDKGGKSRAVFYRPHGRPRRHTNGAYLALKLGMFTSMPVARQSLATSAAGSGVVSFGWSVRPKSIRR
jgi:hypothetical protein